MGCVGAEKVCVRVGVPLNKALAATGVVPWSWSWSWLLAQETARRVKQAHAREVQELDLRLQQVRKGV